MLYAFDPAVKLPYTLEWSVAVEQALGMRQTISASYIGAVGRRLLQTASVIFRFGRLVRNPTASDYSVLQLQFQRR